MKIKDIVDINKLSINKNYQYNEIEYLDTSSVTEGKIEKIQILNLNEAPSRAKRIVRKNDILISTVRPILRHFATIKKPKKNTIASTGFAVISCKNVYPYYLYCYLTTNWYTDYLSSIAESQQSNYPAFNPSLIENTDISLPPLPIQKKIAAVLSAYDDLIENNNRRIAILEKMAEEIYREWFVRMRFPGHEKVKFHKGVPEGWEVEKVKDIVDRKKFGRIYREKELNDDGKITVIDQSVKECLGFYDGKPEHKASQENPIILFGDHTCKMQLMIESFSLAENVIPFKAKGDIPILFLFYLIKNLVETTEYKRHWTELVNKEVYIPYPAVQKEFSRIAKPFLLKLNFLKKSIQKLQKPKDLLLSRLMSGKLSVENLDIQFPPGMEETDA